MVNSCGLSAKDGLVEDGKDSMGAPEGACLREPQRTYLITASTSWFLTVTVMSATVQLPILPEINHVNQEFVAGTAGETSWVPQFIIAGPFSVDGWVTFLHTLFAAVAGLKGKPSKTIRHRKTGISHHQCCRNSEKQLPRERVPTKISNLATETIRCQYFWETEFLGFLQALQT